MKQILSSAIVITLLSGINFAGVAKETKTEVYFQESGKFTTGREIKTTSDKKLTKSNNMFKDRGVMGSTEGKRFSESEESGEIIRLSKMVIYSPNHEKNESEVMPIGKITADEPFAPKVTPPENLENRDMWMNMIEDWDIPGKSEVGIPAYPGAYIVGFMPASEMTANGVKSKTFPTVVLATSDDRAKVTAFYKEQLKDWKFESMMDMFDIFWTGRDEFNSMDIEQTTSTRNINIADALQPHKDFMPAAKTSITIVYNPGK